MERLTRWIAESVARSQALDEERTSVIAYGLSALFQMIGIFFVITLVGAVFDFWYEAVLLFLSVGLLRKSTGGAHSKSYAGCMVVSIATICILAVVVRYGVRVGWLLPLSLVSAGAYILCFCMIYFRAPVDSPNKPIRSAGKIRRLRRNAILTLLVYGLLTACCYWLNSVSIRFLSCGAALTLGCLWQSFTLTKPGAYMIGKITGIFGA
ncbi:MAG: accessory gene regulator ArgB-like protein [Candidatus Howiella sp.]|jgi:accessory gene regulator B